MLGLKGGGGVENAEKEKSQFVRITCYAVSKRERERERGRARKERGPKKKNR